MTYNGNLVRGAVYIIDAKKYGIKDRDTKFAICLQTGKITQLYNNFTAIFLNSNSIKKSNQKKHYVSKCDVHIAPSVCGHEYGAVAKCSQIYTLNEEDIIDYAFTIPESVMDEINLKLLYGIGYEKL